MSACGIRNTPCHCLPHLSILQPCVLIIFAGWLCLLALALHSSSLPHSNSIYYHLITLELIEYALRLSKSRLQLPPCRPLLVVVFGDLLTRVAQEGL